MFFKQINFYNRIKLAVIFFIISALYGLFLRFYSIVDFISIDYKKILQGHSHIAFLGWGFLAVITIVDLTFLSKITLKAKSFNTLYKIMAFSILGMLFSFPIQGYRLLSIAFLSIFLISSYIYLWKQLILLKTKKNYSAKFIKTGIYFYFLSSLAIWLIGIVSAKYGKTVLYYNTIYFYLHFLYNGFFVFTLLGLFFEYIKRLPINNSLIKKTYYLNAAACIPAYSLSLFWTNVPNYIYIIGFIAGLLQLISLYYIYKIAVIFLKTKMSSLVKNVFLFVFTSYFIKIVIQFVSVFPIIFQKGLQLKHYFIIGYLHLFTLGFMSMFIILLLLLNTKIKLDKNGIYTLMFGVFLSEFLLFLQGILLLYNTYIPKYQLSLFLVSLLMPLGMLITYFKIKKI